MTDPEGPEGRNAATGGEVRLTGPDAVFEN